MHKQQHKRTKETHTCFGLPNNNTARLRKETNGKTALYNHIIKGEELKKMLGWFNQPIFL